MTKPIDETSIIIVNIDENPKRIGSKARRQLLGARTAQAAAKNMGGIR